MDEESRGDYIGASCSIIPCPTPPLLPCLPPEINTVVLVGRRHLSRPKIARPELLRHSLRRTILGRNRVDDVRPSQDVEGPVRRRDGPFTGVSLTPAIAHDRPSDFSTGPSFRLPRPEASNPSPRLFFDDREHGESVAVPRPDHRHQLSPAD